MKKVLLVLSLTLLTIFAHARKFYFSSSSGNDSYSTSQAQNASTPWKTLAKISYFVINRSGQLGTLFQAGDTLAFKRGDVFDNGLNSTSWNGAMVWGLDTLTNHYYRAPSGTPTNPIVFTNYGDPLLGLPNFIYTLPAVPALSKRVMFSFFGVHDIVVDGLQFNDTRFPLADKKNPAYTYGGIELGQWKQSVSSTNLGACSNPANRYPLVTNCVVKNCVFNNMCFGFSGVAAIDSKITNNTFTNFKATQDTVGFTDVLGGAIEGLAGFNIEISNNFIKGAWSGSGRVSDCYGLGGVGLDIFWTFKNSKVIYNTFVDCSGVFEVGNRDNLDSCNGAQYDTFAYNKVINCGQLGYLHGTAGDVFKANNHNLYFWNNVVISNNKDRMAGNGFGDDIYGDGQGFKQFWFFRSKNKCPDVFLVNGNTTQGSTTITISTIGLQVGTRLYDDNEIAYRTIVSIGSGQVTVDVPMATTTTGYKFRAYAPISDLSWSYPTNWPLCNSSGGRSVLQYAGDNTAWGMGYDTLVSTRNNIFYSTNGGPMIYDATRTRYKHANNVYYIKGGFGSVTSLGGTLGTGEKIYNTKIFKDTSSAFPENWDLHLNDTSWAIGKGTPIYGVTKDFAGTTLSGTMDIGLYKYSLTPIVSLVSSTNVSCKTATNGSFTIVGAGGTSPYTYKVNTSTFTSTTTYNNLASGTYIITIKDSKGLSSTLNVVIKPSNITCP